MISKEPRCRYGAHQLAEVICQFRFPEILSVTAQDPVIFQEAIRGDFPLFLRRKELSASAPGVMPKGEPVLNFQFSTPDGKWRINLTNRFISLTCTNYTSWEEFAAHLDKPLASFIQIYKPAYFERVGLRYLNFISRTALSLDGVPFRELIAPCYLGPLAEEDISEGAVSRCSMDVELSLRGGCRAKIHAGPGLVRRGGKEDKEIKFIFDQDLFMPGQLPLNLAVGALHTLHGQADSLFRGAITSKLHEAMGPENL
jgi:uncharacterized protein (TIGR04255 family)